MSGSLFRIPHNYYVHVLDLNTNITRLVEGPMTFVRQDNEKVVLGPAAMIAIPQRSYVEIRNPAIRDENGDVVFENGQPKLSYATTEIRFHSPDPFSLFPGETSLGIQPLLVVSENTALKLTASVNCVDNFEKKTRYAGEEWLFRGPAVYYPQVGVSILETIDGTVILANQALRLKANQNFTSRDGVKRVSGEEWIVSENGSYLPDVHETIISVVDAKILTEKIGLHIVARKTTKDCFGKNRKCGEEWLVTLKDTSSYIPSVYEELVRQVDITTLTKYQYCVIENPMENGVLLVGQKKLVRGECSFFLQPGETFASIRHPNGQEKQIQDIFVLGEQDGLVLQAIDCFEDGDITRQAGSEWLIRGPAEYVPPVEVRVLSKRDTIPLNENEGIYVQNVTTGTVRSVCAQSYMLTEEEKLWEKQVSSTVESLLLQASTKPGEIRVPHKVISFKVPHNAAMQIFNYKDDASRIVFGPDLVMLGPDEEFTVLSLSSGKPKQPNQKTSLYLKLGPDFLTDIITVETADHARLRLQLAYNWHFQIDKSNKEDAKKLFTVPDFIGDSCKIIAAKIRGAVAAVNFDDFHQNSAVTIRSAVFGLNAKGEPHKEFKFPANGLAITSVDIQSVEPVHQKTRDALQQSVTLAIQITTESQKNSAEHEARRLEQEALGLLERQEIVNQKVVEQERKVLLEMQAESVKVEACGQARAESKSKAESKKIAGEAAVLQHNLEGQSFKILSEAELEKINAIRLAEIKYLQRSNEITLTKQKAMSEIETNKFREMVTCIGPETLKSIAQAGPEMQAKLLQGLGIKSTLITNGSSPLNLFDVANGMTKQSTA